MICHFCKSLPSSSRAGVKKPPLAPKPKLPATTKPSPPPIAPKPGLLSPFISQPSLTTLKRTKPAVAPKPSIPKSTASSPPATPPPPKPDEPCVPTREQQDALGDGLLLLNSTNGILPETTEHDSDYVIPTCSCGLRGRPQCRSHLENGNTAEIGSVLHTEPSQNGISTEGFAGTRTQERAEHQEEEEGVERGEGGGVSKKPRDKPQRQRHLHRGSVLKEAQRPEEEQGESADAAKVNVPAEAQSADFAESAAPARDAAGSITAPPSIPPRDSPAESFPVECGAPTGSHGALRVPAAPSKPLPVPHPRKPKKPALVRQDGVERGAPDQAEDEGRPSPAGPPLGSDGEELKRDARDDFPPQGGNSGPGDDETGAPVPPPRQTSLSPRLQRTPCAAPPLNKNTSHSLVLLSHADSTGHKKGGGVEHRVEEDEEDGYGDFERYPVTHSLPKQIKLGCHRPPANARKASSPRKPQRHSLPPSVCPPAPPHANTPMRELPAPPQEKTAWRFTRPCVTFFSRQMPSRSSVPPKSRAPAALGVKQRAQSFSAADLATRADSQRRSLSFRKLLELRLSVKLLPKLLAKGGQTLDRTNSSSPGGRSPERPASCVVEADVLGEYEEEPVEYENVPLYEEIPEYMNLPFHGARPGWSHDPDGADSDIYEVQDPYFGGHEHEYER